MKNNKCYEGNLGFMFYKHYYRDNQLNSLIDSKGSIKAWNKLNEKNDCILNFKIKTLKNDLEMNNIEEVFSKNRRFKTLLLKTIYPGLLVGSGLLHGIGCNEEFKIGFQFDYATGLPVILGSSIKGVLRSAFPALGDRYNQAKENYIRELIKNITGKIVNNNFITKLKESIFEGKKDNNNIAMSDRDIFFDAEIYSGDKNNHILGEDFITPHFNQLESPKPLKFLKVLPEVTFKLKFILKDDSNLLKGDEKLELFKLILLDFGIGGKTNVGYGHFDVIVR